MVPRSLPANEELRGRLAESLRITSRWFAQFWSIQAVRDARERSSVQK